MVKGRKSSPGAPTKDEKLKYNKPIHFAVTESEKEELERIMNETGLTKSVLMRFAMKKLFQDYHTLIPQ